MRVGFSMTEGRINQETGLCVLVLQACGRTGRDRPERIDCSCGRVESDADGRCVIPGLCRNESLRKQRRRGKFADGRFVRRRRQEKESTGIIRLNLPRFSSMLAVF